MRVFALYSYNEMVMLGQTREACQRFLEARMTHVRQCLIDLKAAGRLDDDVERRCAEHAERYRIDEVEVHS